MAVTYLKEQQLLRCDGVSPLYRREQNGRSQRYGAHYMTHLHLPTEIMMAVCFGVDKDSRSNSGTHGLPSAVCGTLSMLSLPHHVEKQAVCKCKMSVVLHIVCLFPQGGSVDNLC